MTVGKLKCARLTSYNYVNKNLYPGESILLVVMREEFGTVTATASLVKSIRVHLVPGSKMLIYGQSIIIF